MQLTAAQRGSRIAIGSTALVAIFLYAYSTTSERQPEPRPRLSRAEREAVAATRAITVGGGLTTDPTTGPAIQAPPAPPPLPRGEMFDVAGAVGKYRREAESADGSDYLQCDGDCTGLAGPTDDQDRLVAPMQVPAAPPPEAVRGVPPPRER